MSSFEELMFNDNIITLEVHNKKLYRRIIESFKLYVTGHEPKEKIFFTENSKNIDLSKKIILCNSQSIEYEVKNIQKKLITTISQELYSDVELLSRVEANYALLISDIEDKLLEQDIDLIINPSFTPDKLLKFLDLNIKQSNTDILAQLYQYIDIISELELYQIIVFTNIKLFLEPNELLELIKYIIYKKLNCILLENISNDIMNYETKLIIECDFNDYAENPSMTK